MDKALAYVQKKMTLEEQGDFFKHILTCSTCRDNVVLYLKLKEASNPVEEAPQVQLDLKEEQTTLEKSLNLVASSVKFCFKCIELY